ncbi:MAG: hypothetical protein AAGE59_26240 [Cyanobacteria bacterium P01_F01_bin.86]
MSTLIHRRVESARLGTNPHVICQMPSGWAVLGDYQFIPGYCLLLPDPVVPDLNHLSTAARTQYLLDMTLIGDALLVNTDSHRINYEILGNTEAALHAHLFPRYMTEPEHYRKGPVWHYPAETRKSIRFNPKQHGPLQQLLRSFIQSERAST